MATTRGSWTAARRTSWEPGHRPPAHGRIWSIVLAGGDGARLMGASVHGHRIDRPKQFCRLGGFGPLLRNTLQRVRRVNPPERTFPVVAAYHRQWWDDELRDIPRDNIVVQPRNRGTTLAILHALIHILRRDLDATVVIHPCDHGVEHEPRLLAALDQALARAVQRPGDLVLMGAVPESSESGYGWIVPDPGASGEVASIRAFVEKPEASVADRLRANGALWNTFLFAVSGLGLLEMLFRTVPQLVDRYLDRMAATGWNGSSLDHFYDSAPVSDFSRDVLERTGARLHVVRLRDCAWTDLGTPARLEAWLERESSSVAACASP